MPAKQTQSDLGPTRADSGPAGNSGATASAIRRRRAPSADAAEAPAPTAKQVEATATATAAGRPRLLTWDELPAWRRDNAFIHAGYRATSHSYRRSLQSLAYLHNESVNIWTHLLGAVGFAAAAAVLRRAVAARYAAASAADTLVFACFFAGAASCLGMSAAFHALSNHSDAVARWGNKLDYSGIVFLIVGSYVPALYYGFFCVPTRMTVSLYTVRCRRRRLASRRCRVLTATRKNPPADLRAGDGVSVRLVVRALPHARVAAVADAHLRGPGCLRRRAHHLRRLAPRVHAL